MIRIIKGRYGYRDGLIVRPKTPSDPPFSTNAEEEARLVKMGVAKYVGEPAKSEKAEPPVELPDEEPETDETKEELPEAEAEENEAKEVDLKSLSHPELQKMAKDLGLKASGKKEKLIEAIEKAQAPNLEEVMPQ